MRKSVRLALVGIVSLVALSATATAPADARPMPVHCCLG
jgi:hypothetical protein